MPNTPSHPFQAARIAAESLTAPRVKSQLLAELAQQQLLTEQFEAALQTFADIPDARERRIALQLADFRSFPPEYVEPLVQLLEADSETNFLAGRLALTMLEGNNATSAWKLVDTAPVPFETDEQQYDFLVKALPLLQADEWSRIPRLFRGFGQFRDWAALAIVKHLAGQQRFDEAERFAENLSSALRYSWAYWEMSRLVPAERRKHYVDKAIDIAEAVDIVSEGEETTEFLAIQLRIFGRAAFLQGDREQGGRLLERSEAVITAITLPMQRYRLQCFLGKVLVDLGHIASIREYLVIDAMLESLSSGSDRSRVSVWLAEAGWNGGWTLAIEALATPERGVPESERAGQMATVLKRFVAHHQNLESTGNFSEDVIRLSGEEVETLYFTPFAEEDCGCW